MCNRNCLKVKNTQVHHYIGMGLGDGRVGEGAGDREDFP